MPPLVTLVSPPLSISLALPPAAAIHTQQGKGFVSLPLAATTVRPALRSLKTRQPDGPQVVAHKPVRPKSEHPAKIVSTNSNGQTWIRITAIFTNHLRTISAQVIDSKQS